MLGNEAQSRILINQLLTNAGWRFNNGQDKELYFPANVIPEWDIKSPDGEKMYRADYALFDPHNYPFNIFQSPIFYFWLDTHSIFHLMKNWSPESVYSLYIGIY